jgi:hypothetical protein
MREDNSGPKHDSTSGKLVLQRPSAVLDAMSLAFWSTVMDTNMFFRFANWLFVIECIFAAAFALTAVPFGLAAVPVIAASAGTLGFIILGGYCVLGIGGLLYIWGAVNAIARGASSFWSSFLPAIFGLPVLVWGLGKVQSASNESITALSVAVAIVLATFLVRRTQITTWRFVPALLPTLFFAAVDFEKAGWLHLVIGAVLLVAPLLTNLHIRRADSAG